MLTSMKSLQIILANLRFFFFTTQYTKTIYECLNIYKTHICIYFTMHLQLVYCRIFIKVVV
jgi:hypothetical protein